MATQDAQRLLLSWTSVLFPEVLYDSFSSTVAAPPRRTSMVYMQITMKIAPGNRTAAAGVYQRYKAAFLETVAGATSKELLVRDDDVQVLHGFDSAAHASAYLKSRLFASDVVHALEPLLEAPPEIRIYEQA
jgi:quinol monooxygenase YgiN